MNDTKQATSSNRGSIPSGADRATRHARQAAAWLAGLLAAQLFATGPPAEAQVLPPTVVDPNLAVRTVVGGLSQPTSMAFLGPDDFFVLEKASGQVKRVVGGQAQVVLDLAVNSGSERGLLGIALHPDFPTNRGGHHEDDEDEDDHKKPHHNSPANPGVYLYWTESSTGADTTVLSDVPLLGNRVDRFEWNGSTLTQGPNIIRLRARQADAGQAERGNHNGGVIAFGPDKKLYIFIGDNGRRGWTQNLLFGPFGPGTNDDQFGGPEPDDAHLTGVMLRLNADGTAPADNPFARIGRVFVARLDGSQEVPANASTARGYAAFLLNEAQTSLTFTVSVTGLDFTGTQTADPGDDLLNAHIHVGAPRGTNAPVRFGFFGTPFNDTNPNDVVVTPFADGVGGTVTSKWDLAEGNNTTLAAQLPDILAGRSYINFHTRRITTGEIRGQIEENSQVTANVRKIFGYGFRNSFGFDFDPKSGDLWLQENADDAFTEINRVEPGLDGGWIQLMGPVARYQEFRLIEQTMFGSALQQVRWPPSRLAPTAEEALSRLVMFPGAHYSDPEFSWKFEIAPAGMAFMTGRALGPQYQGDLFLGASRDSTAGPTQNTFGADGFLLHMQLTGNRRKIAVDDPRLEDRVADNLTKHEVTESESLLFGTGFGVGSDIETGPNGNLYVVSLTRGSVYEVFRKSPPGHSKPPKKPKKPKKGHE